ncbi:MAG: hypothetical protein ACR2IE_10905 [Candidatus Sumerlaeaceae bacterium]
MSRPRKWTLIVLSLIVLGACAVWFAIDLGREGRGEKNHLSDPVLEVLHNPNHFELLSLDPNWPQDDESTSGTRPHELFHGYRVLGRVHAMKHARKIVSAIKGSLHVPTVYATCFSPRHGVHAQRAGKTVDLLICYECGSIAVHSTVDGGGVFTDKSGRPVLDEILQKADVPLAP